MQRSAWYVQSPSKSKVLLQNRIMQKSLPFPNPKQRNEVPNQTNKTPPVHLRTRLSEEVHHQVTYLIPQDTENPLLTAISFFQLLAFSIEVFKTEVHNSK
jgi:hypothetical protein